MSGSFARGTMEVNSFVSLAALSYYGDGKQRNSCACSATTVHAVLLSVFNFPQSKRYRRDDVRCFTANITPKNNCQSVSGARATLLNMEYY